MKKNLKVILKLLPMLVLVTAFVIFSWVGAEYIIEHTVTFGVVDGIVAVCIAISILLDYTKSVTTKGRY